MGKYWNAGRTLYVRYTTISYGTKVFTLTKKNRSSVRGYEKHIIKEIRNSRTNTPKNKNTGELLVGKTITRRISIGRMSY